MISPAKKEFIEFMMSADVLRFGEFKTKSGRLSPYFVNTGNYKTGAQISTLGKFYAQCIMENCKDNFDAMFGPAYKGIPLATSAAGALARDYGVDKPYFFNRKEVKDHGEGGSLVGYQPKDGDRIIIIEDVITAGTAVRETVPILQSAAKVTIPDMFISVNRCEVGQARPLSWRSRRSLASTFMPSSPLPTSMSISKKSRSTPPCWSTWKNIWSSTASCKSFVHHKSSGSAGIRAAAAFAFCRLASPQLPMYSRGQ